MSSDTPWKNRKQNDSVEPSAKGEPESRFVDAKEIEQRETYDEHYERIYPLLTAGELDFRQIARETGLKERKIRDVLLSRLANDDMIQLFGHRGGICYVCASRMEDNLTDEPLCIPCIEAIGQVVIDLYPVEDAESAKPSVESAPTASAVAAEKPAAVAPNLPTVSPTNEAMVPKAQFDAIYKELERYRKKYGPLDNSVEAMAPSQQDNPKSKAEPDIESASVAGPDVEPKPVAASGQDIWDILEGDDNDPEDIDEDINYVTLSPNEIPKANDLLGQSTGEPLRHFGFQRLKSRN